MQAYSIQALNIFDTISIKKLVSVLSGKVIDSNLNELQLEYGENSYLFIFRFGTLVAFNVKEDILNEERRKIADLMGAELDCPTSETYKIFEGAARDNVEFEHIELQKISITALRLIALTLGQSAALEYVEIEANRLLQESLEFVQDLGHKGAVPHGSKSLLKFIGAAAANRQHIFSSLAIFDPPDETWTNNESQRLFSALQQNFDIDIRFKALDRKLTLVQDNIEILVNLASTRRAAFLEFMIVVLIILELVFGLLKIR